jgi:arylsulfatase A-like enzyme
MRAGEPLAAGPSTWPRPAAVRDLVTDPARFRPFAKQVSAGVERTLAATPAPGGETRARLQSLRVHLGLYLGHDARALAAATQIRETITPPSERAFSGLLTEAFVVSRAAAPAGPSSPAYTLALRSALESRLATLPATPEITAVLVRQRERFRELTRDSLLAEADALGARLDSAPRWTLADVDDVVRIGHRLATLLPLRDTIYTALAASVAAPSGTATVAAGSSPPPPYNILFLIIDDHGAQMQSVLQASPIRTPQLERLAARGTWFNRAYVDAPACCPSRTAFLTGVHATKSGVYYNNHAYRRAAGPIAKVDILPQHFLKHGYLVAGFGKIAHNRFLADDVDAFTPGHYQMFNRDVTHTDAGLRKRVLPGTEQKMWSPSWAWGMLPDDWDRDDPKKLQQDTEQANRTIALLRQQHDRPFFITCGFWRPHVSWTVPKRYFDRFPLESIPLPPGYRADDLEDLPPAARWLATHREEHAYVTKHDLWKKCLQAYFASIAYIDEHIGRVLDALEASPHRDQTIVVLASDNGFHTGEKDHWSKFFLSELACRVVFSIAVPGLKPQVSSTPVGLIDLYPTLVRLCGLPPPPTHPLDGFDLTPLLRGESAERGAPVLSTFGQGNHSLRDARFRYTRLRHGAEELYDHARDPHEWTNLAAAPKYAAERARLARALPAVNAPEVVFADGRSMGVDENSWKAEAFR